MKKKFNLIVYLFLLSSIIFLNSCERLENAEPKPKVQKTTDPVLMKIRKMGFPENSIKDMGEYYLVEEDIYFSKKEEKGNLRTDQYSTNNLVSFPEQPNITVRIDASIPTSGVDNWRTEIAQAIADWNAVSGCNIHLTLTTSGSADINVLSDFGSLPDNTIAAAEFPTGGLAGFRVRVNLDFFSNMTVSSGQKRYNIVHELGHCIGFRHTNWSSRGEGISSFGANLIHGTPTSDGSSVMNGGTALNSWIGFSYYDLVGAANLYPDSYPLFNLYIIHQGKLYGVDHNTGAWTYIINGDWSGTTAMTSINGSLFMAQGGSLWRTNRSNGQWIQLSTDDWTGTHPMTYLNGYLYMIQGGRLWRTNPDNGAWVQVGDGDWSGTSSMTSVNGYLYMIQGPTLWRTDPNNGSWAPVGNGDWSGTSAMTSLNGYLYMVHGSGLWRTDPNDGSWALLGSGDWTGTVSMTSTQGFLYVMQGGSLWKTNPNDGSWALLGPNGDWPGSIVMTGVN